MKRLVCLGFLLMGTACSQDTVSRVARLAGSEDLVLVDELAEDGRFAYVDEDGSVTGMPNRFLVITSANSDELRVLRLLRDDGTPGRQFVPAPNPLEVLSIPVLSRPSMLAVDEGLHLTGRRVTGSYLYAGRPGAALVSIVSTSPSELRPITRTPFAIPGPLTAMTAWLGDALVTLPHLTQLYVATFDGHHGVVYRITLTSSPEDLRVALAEQRVTTEAVVHFDGEIIIDMKMLPALAGRTVDGKGFCDVQSCLAVATRGTAGADGRTLLIDLVSRDAVPFNFPAPVRQLEAVGHEPRVFAILDEAHCGTPQCSGVMAVEVRTATSPQGFPLTRDFSGHPMLPILTGDSLPMGLALAEGAALRQAREADDGSLKPELQNYGLLGVVSASDGTLTFFDGDAGTVIDYDARRATVTSATLLVPEKMDELVDMLPDAGFPSVQEAGILTPISTDMTRDAPWQVVSIARPDAGMQEPFKLDVSDGYLTSQNVVAVYEGLIPGLVDLQTTSTDGTTLAVPDGGTETRASVGDRVIFWIASEAADRAVCGVAHISAIAEGIIQADKVPMGCAERNRYSVRASGMHSIIVVGEIEGYLGRGAPSDTVVYNRRIQAKPQGFRQERAALQLTIGESLPPIAGASWVFFIQSRLLRHQVAFDATNCTSPRIAGRVLLGRLPTLSDTTGLTFPLEVAGVFPSGHTAFELPLAQALRGTMTSANGFYCHR